MSAYEATAMLTQPTQNLDIKSANDIDLDALPLNPSKPAYRNHEPYRKKNGDNDIQDIITMKAENSSRDMTYIGNDDSEQGVKTSSKRIFEGIRKNALFFLTDVIIPTFDVFSDFSLVMGWLWYQHLEFAISMSIPLAMQFTSTAYKWTRLESKDNKRWSWIPLLLQVWPQWRALCIINLDIKNVRDAEHKKKELMREVISTEPFWKLFHQ